MKILCSLLNKNSATPAVNSIVQHCALMNHAHHEVCVIVHPDSPSILELVKLPIKIRPFKYSILNKLRINRKIKNILNEFTPDIVIAYDQKSVSEIKRYNVPNLLFYLGEELSNNVKCDAVIFDHYDYWLSYSQRIKMKFHENHFFFPVLETEQIEFNWNAKDNSKDTDIFTFGIDFNKNNKNEMTFILQSFSHALQNQKNLKIKLRILSSENTKSYELNSYIRLLGLSHYTQICNDPNKFYSSINSLIFTKNTDDHIRKLNLCFSRKILVIASHNNPLYYILSHGITGLIFDANDIESLTNLITKVISYKTYRKNITDNAAFEIMRNSYSSSFEDMLNELRSKVITHI